MTIQDDVWLITLTGIGIVALVFLYVISQAARQTESTAIQARAYAIRRWFFLALILLGVGVTFATLVPFPIPNQHAPPSAPQIIKVVGHQWAWEIGPGPIKAGEPIEFQVTSADVNHGFAIYDAGGRLLAETQAMPGVTNRLDYTFTQPGKYRILCLEYCGLAHHVMFADLEVIGNAEGRS